MVGWRLVKLALRTLYWKPWVYQDLCWNRNFLNMNNLSTLNNETKIYTKNSKREKQKKCQPTAPLPGEQQVTQSQDKHSSNNSEFIYRVIQFHFKLTPLHLGYTWGFFYSLSVSKIGLCQFSWVQLASLRLLSASARAILYASLELSNKYPRVEDHSQENKVWRHYGWADHYYYERWVTQRQDEGACSALDN